MTNHKVVDVTPQELEKIENTWHIFTIAGKYSILFLCALLIALAAAFVPFQWPSS